MLGKGHVIVTFLNPEGHQNPINGSKVVAILLKGLILHHYWRKAQQYLVPFLSHKSINWVGIHGPLHPSQSFPPAEAKKDSEAMSPPKPKKSRKVLLLQLSLPLGQFINQQIS